MMLYNYFPSYILVLMFLLVSCDSADISLPEISFEGLLSLDQSSSHSAAISLITLGAIQITNIPGSSIFHFLFPSFK